MPRAQRIDDVACAICMDPLFNKLNDLDEVCHTAAPNCGHVFHEECLQQWFRAQTNTYLNNERQRADRSVSPSVSDVPVECPTCRTECYADEEGEPKIRRLFINFACDSPSQRLAGSSPSRGIERGSKINRDLMGLSRRARGLGEEVRALGVGSEKDEVDGTVQRVERLAEDLASVKAVQGVKTYVGGLNTALANLRAALETHPTIPQLQMEVEEMKQRVKDVKKDMWEMANITIPREKETAVKNERVKWENKIKAVEGENGRLRHELKMEQVAVKVVKKAGEDKERERASKIKQLNTRIYELEQRHKETEATLDARSKALKTYQSRAESRKELKVKNEGLQIEVDRLNALLRQSSCPTAESSRPRTSQPPGTRRTSGTAFDSDDDSPPLVSYSGSPSKRARLDSSYDSRHGDDSLAILMPPEDVSFGSSPPQARPSRHPTARTIAFDGKSDFLGRQKRTSKSKSKYFAPADGMGDSSGPQSVSSHPIDLEKTDECNKTVLVPGSSSPVRSSPIRRPIAPLSAKTANRTNPFSTSKEDSDRRKALPGLPAEKDLIDLTDDTPERPRPPLMDRQSKNGSTARVIGPTRRALVGSQKDRSASAMGKSAQGSMVDFLGLKDANGRPKKNVATGEKAKRRA